MVKKAAWADYCEFHGMEKPTGAELSRLALDTFDQAGELARELDASGISPSMETFLQNVGYLAWIVKQA